TYFFIFLLFLIHLTFNIHILLFSLHDALPISINTPSVSEAGQFAITTARPPRITDGLKSRALKASAYFFNTGKRYAKAADNAMRSEEHTSELQSREKLVCRLLLEKKNILHQFL